MSHTMNIKTEMRDAAALQAACSRLGYHLQLNYYAKMYSSTESGHVVYLPGWKYPVVIQEGGAVRYDNYNGSWGDEKELHKLEAYYGLEKAKAAAWAQDYSCTEMDEGGEIKLQIVIGD